MRLAHRILEILLEYSIFVPCIELYFEFDCLKKEHLLDVLLIDRIIDST